MQRADRRTRSRRPHSSAPRVVYRGSFRYHSMQALRNRIETMEDQLEAEKNRRQAAENALQTQRDILNAIGHHFPDGFIIILDADLRCTFFNGRDMTRVTHDPESLIGRHLTEIMIPLDENVHSLLHAALRGEGGTIQIMRQGHPYDILAVPHQSPAKEIIGVILLIQDQTAHRQTEYERSQLARIVELSVDPIICTSLDGIIHTWNEAAERLYGYRREEIINSSAQILFPPGHSLELDVLLSAVGEGHTVEPYETVHRSKSGKLIPIISTCLPISDTTGQVVSMYSIHRDVSDKKASEALFKASKERVQQMMKHLNAAYWIFNRTMKRVVYACQECETVMGVPSQSIINDIRAVLDVIHPDDRLNFTPEDWLANSDHPKNLRFRIVREDGDIRWIELHTLPNVHEIIWLVVDITEQQQSTEKLNHQKHILEHISQTVPDLLYIYDLRESRNIYVNRNMAAVLGYSPEAVQQMGDQMLAMLMHPDDFAKVPAQMVRLMSMPDTEMFSWEFRMQHADGSWHWLKSWEMIYQRDKAGFPVQIFGTAVDITNNKKLEQLEYHLTAQEENQRRWTAFVNRTSQDLRTPLTTINTSLYLIRKVQDSARVNERIQVIMQEVERMALLIDHLQEMASIDEPPRVPRSLIHLQPLFGQIVEDLIRKWKAKRPSIHEIYPNTPIQILGHETQITHAFTQVLDHVLRYTPESGSITIRIRKPVNEGIGVEITDNTSTVLVPDISRIFGRFYQPEHTHEHDTGLGLSIARRIIEFHNGSIRMENSNHQGNRIEIWLPSPDG